MNKYKVKLKEYSTHSRYLATRWYIPGSYLLIMFYIGISLVMSTLSAHQLRHKVSQTQIGDREITMSQIKSIYKNIEKVDEETTNQRTSFYERKSELAFQIREFEKNRSLSEAKQIGINKTAIEIESKLQFVDEKLDSMQVDRESSAITNSNFDKSDFSWNRINKLSNSDEFKLMYWLLKVEMAKVEPQFYQIKNEIDFFDERLSRFKEELRLLESNYQAQLINSTKQIDAILDAHDIGETVAGKRVYKTDKITELLDDYKFWGSKRPDGFIEKVLQPYKAIYFADFPGELLTILVVSIMGILGSLVSLTREFMLPKNNKLQVSDYVFRPVLGAVTAFVVFVLAKAGFLVISTPGLTGEGATISPFFVSFLGLMSGLLAEDALRRILDFGRNLFAGGLPGRDRWGMHLQKIIDDQSVDKNEMADALRVSISRLNDWVEEKKEVPVKFQDRISTYLHKNPREVFTDIAPYQEDEVD